MSFLALDKWKRLFRIIKQNGGLFKSNYKLWRYDTLKEGKYVGCDANGNKYYMNNNYMIGRCRWVEFNMNYRWDYEGSQVTSEWFGWLHYKTDKLPSEDSAKRDLQCSETALTWLQPFVENRTATEEAFYPYSTTRPKINIWDDIIGPIDINVSLIESDRITGAVTLSNAVGLTGLLNRHARKRTNRLHFEDRVMAAFGGVANDKDHVVDESLFRTMPMDGRHGNTFGYSH